MPPRQVSRDLKARIPALRLEFGFSVKEICKILDIRKSLIYKTLHYYGLYGTTSNPHARRTPKNPPKGMSRAFRRLPGFFFRCWHPNLPGLWYIGQSGSPKYPDFDSYIQKNSQKFTKN
jgi:hypothetical protein